MNTPRTALTLGLLTALCSVASPAQAGVEVKKSREGLTYSIRVPPGFDPVKGAPLVFAMHGRGDSHSRFMGAVESAPYVRNAILVAPNASTNAMWGTGDLPTVAALIDELKARYHVTRTIMFGFSAGGYFSFGMGINYPDKIQAVVPHSGGLAAPVPGPPKLDEQAFFVIHGDADAVVKVDASRSAVQALKANGVTRIEYVEIPGLAHTFHTPSMKKAFKWIDDTLGPAAAPLSDADAKQALEAIEAGLDAKDHAATAEAFAALNQACHPRFAKKIAGFVKKALKTDDEPLSLAAIEAAGHLGPAGPSALKSVPKKNEALAAAAARSYARSRAPQAFKTLFNYIKGKSEPVAVAAAEALGEFGAMPGLSTLVRGLKKVEKNDDRAATRDAILAALKNVTGESFETSSQWGQWLAKNG